MKTATRALCYSPARQRRIADEAEAAGLWFLVVGEGRDARWELYHPETGKQLLLYWPTSGRFYTRNDKGRCKPEEALRMAARLAKALEAGAIED